MAVRANAAAIAQANATLEHTSNPVERAVLRDGRERQRTPITRACSHLNENPRLTPFYSAAGAPEEIVCETPCAPLLATERLERRSCDACSRSPVPSALWGAELGDGLVVLFALCPACLAEVPR